MSETYRIRKEAFLHVARNVICLSQSEIDAFSDSECDDMSIFISLSDDLLSHIKINDKDETQERLSSTTKAHIIAFICFYWHVLASGQVHTDKGWFTPSRYDFDAFCESTHFDPYHGKMLNDMYTVDLWSETEFYQLKYPFFASLPAHKANPCLQGVIYEPAINISVARIDNGNSNMNSCEQIAQEPSSMYALPDSHDKEKVSQQQEDHVSSSLPYLSPFHSHRFI